MSAVAFVWGLADATVFFILPDALITRVALRDFRRARVMSLCAGAGALIGATTLWMLAHSNHDRVQILLNTADRLPGISRDHMIYSAQALQGHGLMAVGVGALLGPLHKIFAVHAGAQDFALGSFLAISAVAILLRLMLTCGVAHLAARVMGEERRDLALRLHAWIWMGAYAAYFALVH